MISIIIPHHKESIEILNPLLTSLDNQLGVNFENVEILICNDFEQFTLTNFSQYSNIVNCIKNLQSPYSENPGLSRQLGIDNARGNYILFCDADDLLFSCIVLADLFLMIDSGADMYSLKFLHELPYIDRTLFSLAGFNSTWVFAKLFKRDFLKTNNIRFSTKLKWHEDVYFCTIFNSHKPRIELSECHAYVWRYNIDSVTRINRCEYQHSSVELFIKAFDLAFEYILSNKLGNISKDIIEFIATMYTRFQDSSIEFNTYKKSAEKCLSQFIRKYDPSLVCLTQETRKIIGNRIAQSNSESHIPQEGFSVFIERILS